MLNILNIPKRALRRLALATLAIYCFVGSNAQAEATDQLLLTSLKTDDSVASVAKPNRYQLEIEKLALEISSAKAHRTALAERMDEVRRQLDALQEQMGRENESKPSLSTAITTVNQDLIDIEQRIKSKNKELELRKQQVNNLSLPSLFQDAIGNSDALTRHRDHAVQRYQMHRIQLEIKQSRDKKRFLQARKVSLSETGEQISSSLGQVKTSVLQIQETRQQLELQFTELTSAIVQKQDRLELLKARITQLNEAPDQALFSKQQGSLRDPTSGQLKNRYAEPKARGLLKWEGITISAPLGQQIEAIFDGTVVFADQLQGLGNVAILDHGEGYMSLYGLADFLVVEKDQKVIGGEVIATVGASHGDVESTLYFEIRHNANTLNPEDWLSLERISLIDDP